MVHFENLVACLRNILYQAYEAGSTKSGNPDYPVDAIRLNDISRFIDFRISVRNTLLLSYGENIANSLAAGYILSQIFSIVGCHNLKNPINDLDVDGISLSIGNELFRKSQFQREDEGPTFIWDNLDQISELSRDVLTAVVITNIKAKLENRGDCESQIDLTFQGAKTFLNSLQFFPATKMANLLKKSIETYLNQLPPFSIKELQRSIN